MIDGFRNTAVQSSSFVSGKRIDDLVSPVFLKCDELVKLRDIRLNKLVDDHVEILRSGVIIRSGIEEDIKFF